MDYRAELQILLDDDSMEFETWLGGYPIEEGYFLILEYKNFMQKYALENEDYQTVEELEGLDYLAEKIQDMAIDKLAERQEKCNVAKEVQAKMEILKQEILENTLDEKQLQDKVVKELLEIVECLKSHDMYIEADWKPLQQLL